MNKFSWIKDNILFLFILFLLGFIPLYPKLPVIGVTHTWVYIRAEDFFVAASVLVWFLQYLKKKVQLDTPLTFPIILFWVIGAVSTLYAVLFIFPTIANVFPNVAFFNYVRQIEYLMLFFIGYASIKRKDFVTSITVVIALTLVFVALYGFGQHYFGFPAYLTMNEEFAKGIPLRLSSLARIPSTFGGHYDLAAYLVLIIPLVWSMVFGFKNIFAKLSLTIAGFLGVTLLLMTASRVSFVVYLIAVLSMCILQKKKLFFIPILLLSLVLLAWSHGIFDRFKSTVTQVDVVVDARTGKPLGIANQQAAQLGTVISQPQKGTRQPTNSETSVVIEQTTPTGENLPQGTGYINIPTSETTKPITQVVYKRSELSQGRVSTEITQMQGDFAIKRVFAYDLSFTTRFQGEWPRAIDAFKRNIFLGSGYSSISLATDNNYLRILGETGILGFASFIMIFLIYLLYVLEILPDVDSPSSRSMIIGTTAGLIGLSLNAVLIDVFEASKVAFVLWILIGISVALLRLHQKRKTHFFMALRRIFTSSPALIFSLFVLTYVIFSPVINNYFVADDFTWIRFGADCQKATIHATLQCSPIHSIITRYFVLGDESFYRPLTKLYFFVMYALFGLNPIWYHLLTLFFHAVCGAFIFLLSKRLLQSAWFGYVAAFMFLILSAHSEALYWISSVGIIIASALVLATWYCYLRFKEQRFILLIFASFLFSAFSILFYEGGIIVPFLIIGYDYLSSSYEKTKFSLIRWQYVIYLAIIGIFIAVRGITHSFSLPGGFQNSDRVLFSGILNIFGYIGLTFFGDGFILLYKGFQSVMSFKILFGACTLLVSSLLANIVFRSTANKIKEIILTSFLLFLVFLLPYVFSDFAIRFDYLASFGLVILFVFSIQYLFQRFRASQKVVGVCLCILVIGVFSVSNILQLYQTNQEWQKAGMISRSMLATVTNLYGTQFVPVNLSFYFVNPPSHYGKAWVFSTGIADALWFLFQTQNVIVQTTPSLPLAESKAAKTENAYVFQFTNDYSMIQIVQ